MSDFIRDIVVRLANLERMVRRLQTRGSLGYPYHILIPALMEDTGALAGGALAVGLYSIGPTGSGATYTFGYPAASKALYVRLSVQWAAQNNTVTAYCQPHGASPADNTVAPFTRAREAAITDDDYGIVPLDANGWADLRIYNADPSSVSMFVKGYFQ